MRSYRISLKTKIDANQAETAETSNIAFYNFTTTSFQKSSNIFHYFWTRYCAAAENRQCISASLGWNKNKSLKSKVKRSIGTGSPAVDGGARWIASINIEHVDRIWCIFRDLASPQTRLNATF